MKDYVSTNRQLVADAQQRLLLEVKLKASQAEETLLKELCHKWPVLEKEVQDGPAALEQIRKNQAALAAELDSQTRLRLGAIKAQAPSTNGPALEPWLALHNGLDKQLMVLNRLAVALLSKHESE